MKKWLNEKVFSDNKKTLLFISVATFLVLFIYQIVLFCCGGYFNSNSDDVAQYSPILMQYINYFKEGKFSWYNFSNNTGASVFADVYYVPFDVFTLLMFLFSFVVNDTIAFSIINLSKILFGVVVFAYFLQRKGFKNWIVCLLSLMYFSFGGCWILSVYPTYFSLYFYLPLSLLVIDYYVKGKKWLLPLYSLALVLYNFYNAYTLFIFMVFVYAVIKIRDDYSTFKKFFIDVIKFGLHIVLGVIMGLALFVPSFLYILNYSSRDTVYFEGFFDLFVYGRMLFKLFTYETGVLSFGIGSYVQNHFNYYIGTFGIIMIFIMFTMKDRTSKVYKYALMAVLGMMLVPLFSMIFSGVGIAYTRWFNFINIILIYMVGHVLSNFDFSSLDHKKIKKMVVCLASIYVFSLLVSILFCLFYFNSDSTNSDGALNQFLLLFLFSVPVILTSIFLWFKKKDLVEVTVVFEMFVAILINFSVPLNGANLSHVQLYDDVNTVLESLDVEENRLERVYVAQELSMNVSRKVSGLTNDATFHSFLTKYMYDYELLFGDQVKELYTYYLNRFNPYSSRVMDYKYVVLDKDYFHYNLNYLQYVSEDDNYVVYSNPYYQPFYVYESYYKEEDVLELNSSYDYLGFERNLFNGVVLEGDDYNLERKEYSYSDSSINRINLKEKVDAVKVGENKYEVYVDGYTKYGYEMSFSFHDVASENNKLDIKIIFKDGSEKKCTGNRKVYKCHVSKEVEKVVVEGQFKDLRYTADVTVDDKNYRIVNVKDKEENKYLHYYLNKEKSVILKKGLDVERVCLHGLCVVEDFDYDHILVESNDASFKLSADDVYFDYYYDDLEFYDFNKEDDFAKDKELIYNGSTVSVKYSKKGVSNNDQVVVLPITYSDEWKLDDMSGDYELVRANGGFLGILVKQGVKDIDVNIIFKPSGVKVGVIGSLIGFGIYGVYCVSVYLRKRGKKNEIVEE